MDPGDPYAGRRRGTLRLRLRRQHHRHYGCERKHHYLPLQQLRTGMRDPGFGRTQRVLLLRRRRPSGDAHRPQREHGAYPVTTWMAACTIRPTGRSALLYSNRRVEGTEQKEQTGRKSQAAPEMYGSSVLSSSTAMTEKICVMRRKKTGKSSAFSSTGANWAESFFLCSGRDGKHPVPAG